MKNFKNFLAESVDIVGQAWHGSPHNFNKFSRVNTAHTGEGGAAYGSGIYVSGNKKAAEYYRDTGKKPGTLYQLNINSDKNKMMHWDKPYSEQHPHVQKVMYNTGYDFDKNSNPTGKDIFHHLRKSYYGDGTSAKEATSLASEYLHNEGLHGITYTGDIHNSKSDTINHVLFNPEHIEIKAKS